MANQSHITESMLPYFESTHHAIKTHEFQTPIFNCLAYYDRNTFTNDLDDHAATAHELTQSINEQFIDMT